MVAVAIGNNTNKAGETRTGQPVRWRMCKVIDHRCERNDSSCCCYLVTLDQRLSQEEVSRE